MQMGIPCFLCGKVLHKLGFCVSEEEIRKVVATMPGAIKPVLCAVRGKVEAGEDPPGRAGRVGTVVQPWNWLRVKPGNGWG